AATWFSQPVNGIIRTEVEYFIDELAVVPDRNLNARSQLPPGLVTAVGGKPVQTSIPKADYVRWVVGYDRFLFLRWLNPTNSFTLSMAFNGSFNVTEKGGSDLDFRNANPKPGKPQAALATGKHLPPGCVPGAVGQAGQFCVFTPNHNFEDAYQFE